MFPALDSDLSKIALLGGVAGVLYLLARHLSRAPNATELPNSLGPEPVAFPEATKPAVPLVGYELPFPLDVRELEAKYGPGFARPNILNYYCRETDMVAGPSDPEDFYDEFFVEMENPEHEHRWTTSFHIATPKGLERVMQEDRSEFVYGDGAIIVQRFDLATILRAVLERYAEPNDPLFRAEKEKACPPADLV
ncbi:MAG TPA: hypothetical protein VNK82_06215 [Terriglobales bacterium]|nr:hypothetical protein [Terriglobales bacterium]